MADLSRVAEFIGMRPARTAATTLLAVGLLGLTAAPVQAHTTLQNAVPGIGSTVAPPSQVVLTYADPVRLPRVIVTDAGGGHHESGKAFAVDNQVTEKVGGTLPNGTYTVGWRVVAVDGHPVEGTYRFTVTGSNAPPLPPAKGGGSVSSGGSKTGRWWIWLVVMLGAAVVTGVVLLRRSLRTAEEE
jgi:methionine-rich copper-binding protein CopC